MHAIVNTERLWGSLFSPLISLIINWIYMRLRDFSDLNFSSAFYCAIDLCFFFFPIRPPNMTYPYPIMIKPASHSVDLWMWSELHAIAIVDTYKLWRSQNLWNGSTKYSWVHTLQLNRGISRVEPCTSLYASEQANGQGITSYGDLNFGSIILDKCELEPKSCDGPFVISFYVSLMFT